QALLRFDPKVQLQLPVDAIHALVVPTKSFDVAQVQKAQAEAPILVGSGQSDQPVGNLGVLLAGAGLVAIAGLADLEGPAGVSDARAFALNCASGHLTALRWPHHFFDIASFSRSA